ncbi:hypothetical protein Tco_0388447, partial [Tanacetum coccineum]
MRTQKLAQRFVISSDSTHDSNANAADDEANVVGPSQSAGTEASAGSFYAS